MENLGLSIEGKWINKLTNEITYVSNYVSDGEETIVMTSTGPINMQNFMNDYIQLADDNEYDNKGHVISKADNNKLINELKNTNKNIKSTKSSQVIKFDQEYDFGSSNDATNIHNINNNKSKLDNSKSTQNNTYVSKIEIESTKSDNTPNEINNEQIISKIFDKIVNIPHIIFDIDWDDFPKNEIATLINYLDVDVEDISKYIIKRFVNKDDILDNINKIILQKIHDN